MTLADIVNYVCVVVTLPSEEKCFRRCYVRTDFNVGFVCAKCKKVLPGLVGLARSYRPSQVCV